MNPPNVLLSRAGDVKLSDFGVARDVGGATLTEVGVLRGKLAYASPEVILGEKFDGRADLYALGITLYECLAGQRPFSGNSDNTLARSILEAPVRPISELRPDFSPELVSLFSKLIERSKDARTPSAMALIQQLAALGPEELDLAAGRRELAACVTGSISSKAPPSSAPTQPSGADVATGALRLPV